MGYGYTCDDCGDDHPDEPAPFMGEFRETFLTSTPTGGRLAETYSIGETITLCPGCSEEVFG